MCVCVCLCVCVHQGFFFLKYTVFTLHILLANVQLNKLHVTALLGHHQAYRRLVSFKVQMFAVPMGSRWFTLSLHLLKISYLD